MERILFARIQVWVALLIGLVGLLGVVLFGALVVESYDRQPSFGPAARTARAIAEVPLTARPLLSEDTSLQVWNSAAFAGQPDGWSFPKGVAAAASDGYLLLSRYDGSLRRHVIELVDLRDWQVRHRWTPDADALLDGVSRASRFPDYANWDRAHFRAIHPLLLPDGGMIMKDHFSPLFRTDACARRSWVKDDKIFHHSTEPDGEGGFWVPSLVEPQSVARVAPEFMEDEIVHMDGNGRILFQRSVAALMLREGWGPVIFANDTYHDDPTHLNDIQPVPGDGPFWKKGDVFLSLRNISTVVLYRPSEDRVIWSRTGPWESQHDVDILDDHRITVYDNHAQDRGGTTYFESSSDLLVYDFADGSVKSLLPGVFARERIKTATAGLSTVLPGGKVLVEDVTNARLILFSAQGEILASYVNRAQDDRVYHLGWSRLLARALGDEVLANVARASCDD